eukprot:9941678-Alexandrium_andersonii.AAC.1
MGEPLQERLFNSDRCCRASAHGFADLATAQGGRRASSGRRPLEAIVYARPGARAPTGLRGAGLSGNPDAATVAGARQHK